MRVFLVAVLVALAVYVSGEHCGDNHDCHQHGITHCGGNTHVVCHDHMCECTDGGAGGQSCTTQADCNCGHHGHCVDGECHCAGN
ncbi:N-acetylglucosamine-1-phosphodiester alpha-N-acetylglucosaminidase-like [Mercenaria mercenaria]|uniref:N-acetylglucosamine-1-phosphodiester alpha-N-acetylglucosaminidase-like n=1 Tax=Mercenaria mercenaria TaxID=6596 RepID=UPI00234E5693|nr:N-acetylglucosamine-1-phosphodiester alpha-N-acetylglucosaminidase-like [Mercenaria mercenaria]